MTPPRNILIIRLSAIGDVVMASPLIQALRRSHPQARLSWLVEPAAKGLLEHNAALHEVIVWPKEQWKRLWREGRRGEVWAQVRAFRRGLRERQFDLVLDLQGLLKSALWARLSGAPERVGLGSKEGSAWLMTRVIERGGDPRRIGSEYLHLARQLGLHVADFAMDIALSAADECFATDFAAAQGRYVVLCPFTTRPQKHWIESRWPVLAQALKQRQLQPVLLGGPADVEAARRIVTAYPEIINRVGECTLTQSAALIKHASLLVGVDTGLTHMGIAFNVPTVAIFGSTCPYLDTDRANAKVIYHQLECSPCRRNPTCEGRFDCMQSVTVPEVMATADEVLAA